MNMNMNMNMNKFEKIYKNIINESYTSVDDNFVLT